MASINTSSKSDDTGTGIDIPAQAPTPTPTPSAPAPEPTPAPADAVILLSDAIAGATSSETGAMAAIGASSAAAAGHYYDDPYVGMSGTYTYDNAGNRVPVYEKYTDPDTGEQKTRPVR